jgi:hypothetical protein
MRIPGSEVVIVGVEIINNIINTATGTIIVTIKFDTIVIEKVIKL